MRTLTAVKKMYKGEFSKQSLATLRSVGNFAYALDCKDDCEEFTAFFDPESGRYAATLYADGGLQIKPSYCSSSRYYQFVKKLFNYVGLPGRYDSGKYTNSSGHSYNVTRDRRFGGVALCCNGDWQRVDG